MTEEDELELVTYAMDEEFIARSIAVVCGTVLVSVQIGTSHDKKLGVDHVLGTADKILDFIDQMNADANFKPDEGLVNHIKGRG